MASQNHLWQPASAFPLYRIILHIDFNCFYASVAALYNPALRDIPVAVTGEIMERCGVILAKNYQAKASRSA